MVDILEQSSQFPMLSDRTNERIKETWNNDWSKDDVGLRFELMQSSPDELRELALLGLRAKNNISLQTPIR